MLWGDSRGSAVCNQLMSTYPMTRGASAALQVNGGVKTNWLNEQAGTLAWGLDFRLLCTRVGFFPMTAFRVMVRFYSSCPFSALHHVNGCKCWRALLQNHMRACFDARCWTWLEEEKTKLLLKHVRVPDSGCRSKPTLSGQLIVVEICLCAAAFITGTFLWDYNKLNANKLLLVALLSTQGLVF